MYIGTESNMTKTQILAYLTSIQLIDTTFSKPKPKRSDEKLNFYYVRFGPVRILFCKHHRKITSNSFNLYQPSRRSLLILYKGLKIINDYTPSWLLGLFLKRVEVPTYQFNLQYYSGLHAVFLGASNKERKFICLYDDFVEKQCTNPIGQKTLSNEIKAMTELNATTLSNYIVPHKVIRTSDGSNILRSRFISAKRPSKNKLNDIVITYARSLLAHHIQNKISHKCLSHGDFTPWNIRLGDASFYIIDWENFSEDRPLLFDLFYFFLMQAALGVNGYHRDNALIEVSSLYEKLRSEHPDILPNFSVAFTDWCKFVSNDSTSNLTIKKFIAANFVQNV